MLIERQVGPPRNDSPAISNWGKSFHLKVEWLTLITMNKNILLTRRAIFQQFSAGLLLPIVSQARPQRADQRRILLDADTANEVDDLWAIVRAFHEPAWQIEALSSAQWTTRTSPPNTVLESQRLNEDLLRLMNRQEVPAPLGAEMIMGKPWGGDEPRDSAAARIMIRNARQTPAGQKLTIISIGAVTNVASAIKLAPDIVPKISCYILSARYFADRKVWDKDEFNTRNDLNAANFLFNQDALELHVMPVNILLDYKFDLEASLQRFMGKGALWDYLGARWLTHSPQAAQRIMWDLALIQAIARPELAQEAEVLPPPENKQRKILAYTRVDSAGMQKDWWDLVTKLQQKRG
jgi:inosine-uridine nucleoside N-ribohydrolase